MEEDSIILNRKKLLEKLECPLVDPNSPEYTSHEINWIDDIKTWKEAKNKALDFMFTEDRLVFLAHDKDSCNGKPQLIHQTIQRMPLVRKVQFNKKATKTEPEKLITQWKFIDDKYDKRYDGRELSSLAFDFWVYRLVESGKEYYLLSANPLTEEYSTIKGMKIEMDDMSGISETFRVNKIATIMIVKEFKSAVRVLPLNDLIKFVKEKKETNGWTAEGFQDYIFTHPDGNIYDYCDDFNKLRVAQFLSGKYEGYPLHIMKMGPVGTGKTTEAEAIDAKFKEELGILEAGTSRMKVLVPSFKEKPANLGYICNCNRVAIVDELMKMVASAMQQHIDANNYFGELNMLLEHKKRLVGSGNDNSTIVKTTAKVCITTNPIKGKNKLVHHLSLLDNTTLSRMLIWVQDKEEVDKIYAKDGIRKVKVPQEEMETYVSTAENIVSRGVIFSNSLIGGRDCILGNYQNSSDNTVFYDFLTIYDSCQTFLVDFDMVRVKEIFNKSIGHSKDAMQQVWKSRGLHHSILILDGLTKFRCLFKDSDISFKSNDSDYEQLEKIILHMIQTWNADLELTNWEGGF